MELFKGDSCIRVILGNIMGHLSLMSMLLFLGTFDSVHKTSNAQEVLKASQCFKSRGIPKVSFDCAQDQLIQINKAFHGIAQADRSRNALEGIPGIDPPLCLPNDGQQFANCSFCDGDCVDDSMNLVYDWSTCMGNTSCIRTVMQSYMPLCQGRDKFSDYLQVEYQCIPRSEVIDICTNLEKWASEGYLMSPNYPEHYPINIDCSCEIQTDWNSRILLSFYDLLLETKQVAGFSGRCRADWLMLRQGAQKHRHCGAIMTGTKNITSKTNSITLQFHSDQYDNRTQNFQYFSRKLKGFWLHFKAEPQSSMQITCRKLTGTDPEVQEIYSDDEDYTEVISTKDTLITVEPDTTTASISKEDSDTKEDKEDDDNGIKQGTGENEDKVKNNGQENEVDAQGADGKTSNTVKTTAVLLTYLLPWLCMVTLH